MNWGTHYLSRIIVVMLLCFVFSLCQYTILPFFLRPWMVPDLNFILFMAVTTEQRSSGGLIWGIFLGYFTGLLSGVGHIYLFTWPVVGFLIPFASQGVYIRKYLPLASMIGVTLLLTKILNLVTMNFLGLSVLDKWWRFLYALPLASVTGLLGPLIFKWVKALPGVVEEDKGAPMGDQIFLWRGRS